MAAKQALLILILFSFMSPSASAWMSGYSSRIDNDITEAPNQFRLAVHNGTGTNNATDVFISCLSVNCSDVKFKLNDNTNLTYYWERNTSSGTGIIWIDIPENGFLNLYYGKTGETFISNLSTFKSSFSRTNPSMSSYIEPSGTVTNNSAVSDTYAGWRAYDGSYTLEGWAAAGTTAWTRYQFTSQKIVNKYKITSRNENYNERSPKNWTLEGSNDGSNYTILDTQTDVIDWYHSASYITKSFDLAHPGFYLYNRINITAGNDPDYIGIGELEYSDGRTSAVDSSFNATWSSVSQSYYVPPVPINYFLVISGNHANLSWSPGSGNISDIYHVSINGAWNNTSSAIFRNISLSESQWLNVSIFAYNISSGILNDTALTNNTYVTVLRNEKIKTNIISNGIRPYQYKLVIDRNGTVDNSTHVSCDGECYYNLSDVIFEAGNTQLYYFVEDLTSGIVWVNITENGTFKMHYGGSTNYLSHQNGTNTFRKYLDFENTIEGFEAGTFSSTYSKYGTYSLKVADSYGSVLSYEFPTPPYAMMQWYYMPTLPTAAGPFRDITQVLGIKRIFFDVSGVTDGYYSYGDTALRNFNPSVAATAGRWEKIEYIIHNSSNYSVIINNVFAGTLAYNSNTSTGQYIYGNVPSSNWYIDGITVRTYTSPEPSFNATWTAEASAGPYIPPIPKNFSMVNGTTWNNFSWQPGTGNITNSYAVNVNGTWHNQTQTYLNLSTLGWTYLNISIYAINSTFYINNTPLVNNSVFPSFGINSSYLLRTGDNIKITPTCNGTVNNFETYWNGTTWNYTAQLWDAATIKTLVFNCYNRIAYTDVVTFRNFTNWTNITEPIVPSVPVDYDYRTDGADPNKYYGETPFQHYENTFDNITYYALIQKISPPNSGGDWLSGFILKNTTDFVHYNNMGQVFSKKAGTFYAHWIIHPEVLYVNGTTHLFFGADATYAGAVSIGHATGTNFSVWSDATRLFGTADGDGPYSGATTIVNLNGEWNMFSGTNTREMHWATSPDLFNWTYRGKKTLPVFGWEGSAATVTDPFAYVNKNGIIEMVNGVYGTPPFPDGFTAERFGYGLSKDGDTWYYYPWSTIYPVNEAAAGFFVCDGSIYEFGDRFYVTYTNCPNPFNSENPVQGHAAYIENYYFGGVPPITNPIMTMIENGTWINNSWTNPGEVEYSHAMLFYENDTRITNITKPLYYWNHTGLYPGFEQKIYAQTVDIFGTINETKVWFNGTIPFYVPPGSIVPPVPINLAHTEGNFWISYTWSPGSGNLTDSYNVSINGTWTNGTTATSSNGTVAPHGWRNITVFAFNHTGNGTRSPSSATHTAQVPNNIPIQATIGDKSITAGDLLSITVSASDADSDTILYQTNASKGIFNNNTGVYSWQSNSTDAGTYIWYFTSADAYGGTDTEIITVLVNPNPSTIPPTPTSLSSTQGNFWVRHAWQPGSGNLTDSYNVSINGAWTNGTTATFNNGTVSPHGWRNITVYAYNASGNGTRSTLAASQNVQVANNAPNQASIGGRSITAGELLSITVSATDADGDTVTRSTNATKGSLNTTTGVYTWQTTGGDAGTYIWYFTSSDAYGGSDTETITITVSAIACPGDLNADATVNFADFVQFSSAYNSIIGDGRYIAGADMNQDGLINFSDFVAFSSEYGTICG